MAGPPRETPGGEAGAQTARTKAATEAGRKKAAVPNLARAPRGAKARAEVVRERLASEYPGSAPELCALVHDTPFELLIATILSAQCTDEMVNKVAPAVFARYPTATDLAAANPLE